MSARDELAKTIEELTDSWCDFLYEHEVEAITDTVLAAGYAKPQVITAIAELIELEEGAVIRDEREVLVLRDLNGDLDWLDLWGTPCHVHLPATVLFTPEVKA